MPDYQILRKNYVVREAVKGTEIVNKLKIVANIHANPDQIDLVKAELEKLISITRNEEGCIRYDLLQDNVDPAHFVFFENWQSRESWQTHMNAPHLATYLKQQMERLQNLQSTN